MSETLRAFPNLWDLLPSLWILISSRKFWDILWFYSRYHFPGLAAQESRKMPGGTWAQAAWGKCEHPCDKPCRASSVSSWFQHILLPTYICNCCYSYLCCAGYADVNLCLQLTRCILHEVSLLPSIANTVLVLFIAQYVSFVFFLL